MKNCWVVCGLMLGTACAPDEVGRMAWASEPAGTDPDGGIDASDGGDGGYYGQVIVNERPNLPTCNFGSGQLPAPRPIPPPQPPPPEGPATPPMRENLCGCGYRDTDGQWKPLPTQMCRQGRPERRWTECHTLTSGRIESARCGAAPMCMPMETVQVLPSNASSDGSCADRNPCPESFTYTGETRVPTSCSACTHLVAIDRPDGGDANSTYYEWKVDCQHDGYMTRSAQVTARCERREHVEPAVEPQDGVELDGEGCFHLTAADGSPQIDVQTGEVQCSTSCFASAVLAPDCEERRPISGVQCVPRSRFLRPDAPMDELEHDAQPTP